MAWVPSDIVVTCRRLRRSRQTKDVDRAPSFLDSRGAVLRGTYPPGDGAYALPVPKPTGAK
jgi:hypothetical protein